MSADRVTALGALQFSATCGPVPEKSITALPWGAKKGEKVNIVEPKAPFIREF